ncbi:MAG: DUF2115 domain-containing protein [Methanobrevibacter sp.]|uniref:UPF0305 protein E7Z73_07290 n=1 Tax=Methanobrevibacter millerae TaxID=230361 RepID=A0A8T3VGC5_9EURY|nr:DUF2115 domain-containing protein [Methanobrevibacter millerae]MBE6505525.1 DUF2115 domain-containing protein [Methanobrevibacter millerae]MBR0059220.1 DUF2115 domain-containing protein [Methanobrevibacter sp.]MBR0371920.1 DUF2115 domain-containing protein [Methanobrevibacter sp.]
MDNKSIYEDFTNISSGENSISKDALLNVLKRHSGTISVFDLMEVTTELIDDTQYVQKEYREKSHAVYVKYFLGRIKSIRDDNTEYDGNIDKEDFIDSVATLKSYHEEESITSKTKFPLIYAIVSLYTTYILEEPIHPVGTPFPGSLKVIEKDGIFYCPVKESNLESPNAVCKMCIAEQLEF